MCNPIKHITSVSRRTAEWTTVSSPSALRSSFPLEKAPLSSIPYRRLPFRRPLALLHFRRHEVPSPFRPPIGFRTPVSLTLIPHRQSLRFLSFSAFILVVSRYPSRDHRQPALRYSGNSVSIRLIVSSRSVGRITQSSQSRLLSIWLPFFLETT